MTHHTTPAGEPGGNATEGRAMSDLRDRIADLVHGHNVDLIAWEVGARDDDPRAEDVADAIFAIIREAMLSDAAIDGMLARSYGWVDYEKGLTYPDLPEEKKADVRIEGRHEMMGALDAAGIGEQS